MQPLSTAAGKLTPKTSSLGNHRGQTQHSYRSTNAREGPPHGRKQPDTGTQSLSHTPAHQQRLPKSLWQVLTWTSPSIPSPPRPPVATLMSSEMVHKDPGMGEARSRTVHKPANHPDCHGKLLRHSSFYSTAFKTHAREGSGGCFHAEAFFPFLLFLGGFLNPARRQPESVLASM